MQNKIIAIFFGLALSATAFADPLSQSNKSKAPELDLIKESESLMVLEEQSVERTERETRYILTAGVGQMSAQSLSLTSHDETIHYDLSNRTPVFAVEGGVFPAALGGNFGITPGIGYSYREQLNTVAASALHLMTTELLLTYRYERDSNAWAKPYIMAGPGMNIAIQRGVDQLNTSEAHGIAVGAIGVGLNIKRLFKMNSPLDWELNAQYKRWMEIHSSNANYNGQVISLGLSTLL